MLGLLNKLGATVAAVTGKFTPLFTPASTVTRTSYDASAAA